MYACLNWVDKKGVWKPEFVCEVSSKRKGLVYTQVKPGILPEQTKIQIQTKILSQQKKERFGPGFTVAST